MRNCSIITVDILNKIEGIFNQEGKENMDIIILNQKSGDNGTDIYLINYENYKEIKKDNVNIDTLFSEKRKEQHIRNNLFIFRKISNDYLNQFSKKFNLYEKIQNKGITFLTVKDLPFLEEEILNFYKNEYLKDKLDASQFLLSILIHLLIHIFYSLEEYTTNQS